MKLLIELHCALCARYYQLNINDSIFSITFSWKLVTFPSFYHSHCPDGLRYGMHSNISNVFDIIPRCVKWWNFVCRIGWDRCLHCMCFRATFTFSSSTSPYSQTAFRCFMLLLHLILQTKPFHQFRLFSHLVKAIPPNAHNFHGRSRMFVIFDEYAAYTSRNKKPRKSQNYDFCCCSVELFGSKFVASKTHSASEVYCVCVIEQEQSAPLWVACHFRRIKRKTMSFVEWKRIQAECFFGGFCGSTQYIHHTIHSHSLENLSL